MADPQRPDRAAWEGELFRLLAENVLDYAIFLVDPEGRVSTWSRGAGDLLGYAEGEVLGRPAALFFTPEDLRDDAPRREREQALATGRGADDRWHVRKDGSRFWASGSLTPLRDEAGALRGFAKILRDRTGWWHAERARREGGDALAAQMRLSEFGGEVGRALTRGGSLGEALGRCAEAAVRHLDAAFARIWTADESGEVLELRASAGMYTHLDGPHGRIPVGRYKIGQIARDRRPHLTNAVIGDPLIPAQDWAAREGMVAFAGYPLVVEGRLAGVLAIFARHELAEATLRMMASVADEIALGIEQRRAAERLAREREWLRVTLASVGDAVIATDTGGRVTFLNAVAEGLTGWTGPDAAGARLEEVFRVVDEATREPIESPAARAIREGATVGLADHAVLIARDGTERAIDDSAAPIRGEGGEVLGAILIFRDVERRRAAERALEASEARKAAILRTALDAIITIDHRGRILEFNPAAEAMFGYDPARAIGREMCELIIPPPLRDAHRRGLAHFLATGEGPILGRRIEVPAARADGTEFPIELAITPISSGGPPAFTAQLRDITARRKAEGTSRFLAAAASELAGLVDVGATLRAVAEHAVPDFADWCLVDLRGGGGDGLRRVAAAHPDPAARREALDLFDRDPPRPDEPSGIARALRDGVPELGEGAAGPLRIPGASGSGSYLCAPIRSRGGTLGVIGFAMAGAGRRLGADDLAVAEDLARRVAVAVENADLYRELREADRLKGGLLASLRDSEERFRTMADSIPQLAWMARPDGHIYWYNRRWYEYTGATPEQMEGWGWQTAHDPATLPAVIERWAGSIASGEPFDMVFPLKGADGEFRPFLTRVMPVRGEDGRVAHWFGTNTDIADRQRHEDELRAAKEEAEGANQAKTQFLAVLSHELRTPLNPILLATTAMLERPGDPGEVRPTLEMIRQNVYLQARLIDDLLDVMRIVRGKMPLHWEVADCHGLIRQAVQICRSEVYGHELRLTVDLASRTHHVNADPARLQQVFWNLIKNAVKFTPEGGAVAIRSRYEEAPGGGEGQIVIEVSDTGIGIDAGVLPLIFDPFQQGETTITRRFGGLGLGLAICKGIVEAHGGSIDVKSPGPGLGTTFRVALNALPEPTPEGGDPSAGPPASAQPLPASLHILVVEDEPATLRLMARLLRGLGHRVTTANAIGPATEAYRAGEFDLIVSDIGLPDGSGLELMRRAVALKGHVPAIALTGYGMEEDIRRSREAGFTAHLTKPIDFVKLEAMIRQVAPTRP